MNQRVSWRLPLKYLCRNFSSTSMLLTNEKPPKEKGWFARLLGIQQIEPLSAAHSSMLAETNLVYELIIHLWRHKSGYNGTDKLLEALDNDPDLKLMYQEQTELCRRRESFLMLAFTYWGDPKPRPPKHIYEMRSYNLKAGTMIEWGNNWAKGITHRRDYNQDVAGFFTQVGPLYKVIHFWAYENLAARKKIREDTWSKPGWDQTVAYTVPLIKTMQSKIMMYNFPVIILMSGKRKSGKDFVAEKLCRELSGRNIKVSKIHLSEPLKRQYAALHNLDAENLLTSGEYKENYRREMVIWGENIRRRDPSYFCRAAVDQCCDWVISDVKIVCDCRRPSDIAYFESNFSSKNHRVLKLRIESDKKTRTSRGWTFTPEIDDSATEISLDNGVSWDFILNNNNSNEDFGLEYANFLEIVLSRNKYVYSISF
uniref:Phosphomevalonate kinase n=1 Tax=Romanomermis culicivorax TaxID=13658 RepID=A0A915KB22_ROMCU